MRIVVSTDLHDGPWTPGEWNTLAAASETNTVFQTFQWHAAWWKTYGAGCRGFIISGWDGDRLVGIAPLVLAGPGAAPRLSFLGDGRSDYHDVIVAAEHKLAFLDAVLALLRQRSEQWGSLVCRNIPAQSATISTMVALCREHQLHPLIQAETVIHVLVMEGVEPQALAVMNREDLRRRTNYFRRTGTLNFFRIEDQETGLRYLSRFFEQHCQRWRSTGEDTSLFEDPVNRRFYGELLAELLPQRWLHWSVLEFNGRPIAFHFGFDYRGVLTWYKPTFDMAYAKRSPGKVLLRHLIGHALEQRNRELDYTVGDEPFKRRFKNVTRKNQQLAVFHKAFHYHRSRIALQFREAARTTSEAWRRSR